MCNLHLVTHGEFCWKLQATTLTNDACLGPAVLYCDFDGLSEYRTATCIHGLHLTRHSDKFQVSRSKFSHGNRECFIYFGSGTDRTLGVLWVRARLDR